MNEVVHTSPTLGSNVEEVNYKNVKFLMWDLGNQKCHIKWMNLIKLFLFFKFLIENSFQFRIGGQDSLRQGK